MLMDAGRLQALASNLPCCPHHDPQLQLVSSSGRLKSTFTPGLALHHHVGDQGKHRGAKSTVIRAAIPHDLAAVAVAAATVLPMCWIYVKRGQFSTASGSAPASASAAHDTASSAASASTILASTTAVAEIGPSSTIGYSNGAASEKESDGVVTKVQARSSVDRVVEDEWLAIYHETLVASVALDDEGEIRSGEGRNSLSVAPSPSISWFEQNVHDSAGRPLPTHPADPAYSEVSVFFESLFVREFV